MEDRDFVTHPAPFPEPIDLPGRRRSALPVSLLLPVVLAACAAAPVPEPAAPRGVPAVWSAAAVAPARLDRAALAQWWRQFDDPLLTALIDEAWQGNTDLATAQARLAQARALRDSQSASAAPQLGSSAGVSRTRTGLSGGSGSSTWQAGLDASWEPDFFGGSAAALRGREQDVKAAQANLATTRMTVAAEVGLAYVALRGNRRQLAIAEDNLQAQEQTQSLTRWRAQAGLASTLDAEQARLSTEQLRATLPALRAAIAQSEHRIAVLLGLPPAALRERLGSGDRVPQALADLPAGVPVDVLRLRPDVRAAEATWQAEAERLGARRAERWPSFLLSGSLALKAATLSALGASRALVGTVAAAVDWPLWDGGARVAAIAQQQAVRDAADAAWRAAVLTALEDVENALTTLAATRAELQSLTAAREAAANALLLARQRWQAGLIDFGTLLEAQRSALSADKSLAAAQADGASNLIGLYKALGGGWSDEAASAAADPVSTAVPTAAAGAARTVTP